MKNKTIICFLLIGLVSVFLICGKNSDNVTLDEVRLRDEIEVNKRQFAMYTRDSEDSDYTEYTGEDLFPKGYKLNTDQSSCMDINGDEVTTENIITQTNDGKIMVTSTKTVYCTFYFDKKGPTASETLTTNPSSYLKEGDHGDLHWRYVGKQEQSSSIKNYVCFGASSCTGETDNHMYRIIGITEQGNLKIQKNSSITPSQWANNSDIKWPNSTVYSYLTGNSFYTSDTYVSQDMKSKIDENHTWNTGDVQTYTSGDTVYNLEQGTKTHTGAVGLAYLSDYYYAYDENGNQNCNSGEYCKSWMVPSNYQTLWSSQSYEWTMTRYGPYGSGYRAWFVNDDGYLGYPVLGDACAVRPVFYLTPDITISGGNGILSDPFVIN